MDNRTIEELRKRGHEIGQAGMSHDGKNLLGIDGTLLTYPEIDELLRQELEKERQKS